MANNAAPSRAQEFAAIRAFLADNGIISFRVGWFQPGEDGPDVSNMPICAFLPQPQQNEQAATGGGTFTDDEIQCQLIFPCDASGPYSATYNGWTVVWKFRDDIFTGPNSIGRWSAAYGSGQFEAQITKYEEWTWISAETTVALMAELTFKIKLTAAPAPSSDFAPSGSILTA